ncbi:hypothetical protein U1769_12610 [Sphingomonas sp. ZT3P38]|uniref:hypothetical protein n=1 Tax=Parasphingomonas zepuensis TaxID=3096161 RepID=UPI002FCAF40C
MKRILLLFAVLLTCAAANDTGLGREKYKLLSDSGATATARFPKGNLRLSIMRGDTQYYGVLRGDTCKSAQKLTVYSAGIGGNTTEKVFPIEAGHKLRILASVQKQYYAGYLTESFSTCTRIVEFTPGAGKTYLITQEADAARPDFCAIGVKEEVSGEAPADLADGPPLSCRF